MINIATNVEERVAVSSALLEKMAIAKEKEMTNDLMTQFFFFFLLVNNFSYLEDK